MSVYQLTSRDCIPPVHDSVKELTDYQKNTLGEGSDNNVIVESCRGKVLAIGKHNNYDDSDFYALIWDDNSNEAVKFIYKSTHAWTYLNSATPDATEAIKEKYDRHLHRKSVIARYECRKALKAECHDMRITIFQYQKLEKAYNGNDLYIKPICKMLKVKRFRSDFRNSLVKQIRKWLNDPKPFYERPLSVKQEEYV